MKRYFYIVIVSVLVFQMGYGQIPDKKLSNLMPLPKEITFHEGEFVITRDFSAGIQENSSKRVKKAVTRFIRKLGEETGVFFKQGFPVSQKRDNVLFKTSYDREGQLNLFEDESYVLTVSPQGIQIDAPTDIGVIRGVETLLQLVHSNSKFFYIPSVTIKDSPRFPWRGLMIDVARHFQPLDVIKRNLDAMAAVKLNVFHWHLTDDQGFRVESKTFPKLHELGSEGQFYTHEQIREVIQYASDRGIRVLPEFDVPGHATAILTAYPEIASKDTIYTIERNSGIFDPTLDPTKEKTYEFLAAFFKEMSDLFPDEYIHIGGDENEGKHWDENERIRKFKKHHGFKNNHELQTYFNIKIQKILKELNKKMMGWEEIMSPDIEKSAVLHSWRGENEGLPDGESLINAVKLGYHTVLSNGYYIDRMHPVENHYLVDPHPKGVSLTKEQKAKILGGEVTMWSELVTPTTIDSRIWPRTAAIAERFWSPATVINLNHMKSRLEKVSLQLEKLGITHIKNANVILRNITKENDIEAILTLSRVCEPLKNYERNKGGTEYQTYSPFTLFADACTSDALDAKKFNDVVLRLLNDPNDKEVRSNVHQYLSKWSSLSSDLDRFDNPVINQVKPIAVNLSALADILSYCMKHNKISSTQLELFDKHIETAKIPVVDVELAVIPSFENLVEHFKKYEKAMNN
ncbi:family 20 glycosylhydrolase [Aquimarina sp. U1-2]|uniref:beta-N-acetylhexosaminidase n=1 Tax=Aquimarina sp. U1-2 TaxID=2823141 RepID=UPI001AECE561|nr:family 20 glycosylhydrolase [Aquimarina sp. U1-2]MBP2833008.1 family 20 glycosylhydrolase [Aquimarina sp. U1-2]